jgi:5-methylcytosine-specific restriction enzyme A
LRGEINLPLRDALIRVLDELPQARSETYAGHSLARFIRDEAAGSMQEALGSMGKGTQAHGSAGAGQWAAIPWVAVFDELVTDSATRGYYLVYLFHISRPIVHLSLNQGTTATRAEFKGRTREVLRDRASLMRRRLLGLVP